MDIKNIPKTEEFDGLVEGLSALAPLARTLCEDPVHSRSPHIAGIRSKIESAIAGVDWHALFLKSLPDPAPAPSTLNPQPSTPSDASAGTPGN